MKNKLLIISSTFLVIFIASCVVGPNYKREEFDLPQDWLYEESGQQDSVLNLRWWEIFGNEDLDTLIMIGLRENPDIMSSVARIDQAMAVLGFTKADQKPRIDYAADYGFGTAVLPGIDNGGQGVWTAGANINWEINFFGKFRRANEAARADLLASDFGLRSAQLSLISAIAETYFVLLDFKWRKEIAIQTSESRQVSLDIVRARYEAGIVPEIDLNQAQIQSAIAEATIPFYERAIRQTENALQVLLGRYPGSIPTNYELRNLDSIAQIPAGIPSSVLYRRPDLIQAEQFAVAATANVGVAQALRYPTFNITGLLGVASPELSSAVGNGAFWWSAGASALGPLFYFGQNKRRVEIERAKAQQAVFAYQSTVLQSFREVEDALIAIETLKEELISREDHVRAAVNARILSRDRYDQGVTSYLEVLETERQAFDAELFYSETKSNLFIAYVELYRALGGGWVTPEEEQFVIERTLEEENVETVEELEEEVTSDKNVKDRQELNKIEKELNDEAPERKEREKELARQEREERKLARQQRKAAKKNGDQ